jgi:hypothetical protein
MEDISLGKPEQVDGYVQLKVSVMATAFHALEGVVAAPGEEKSRRRDRRK